MDTRNLVCSQEVLELQCVDIRRFHLVRRVLGIRRPLFEQVNCRARCIGPIERMEQVLCMVQRTFREYRPICLDNRRHICIQVQHREELVHNTTVDFRLADCQGIYSWRHGFERSKRHLERMVNCVRMDWHNDCLSRLDLRGIRSRNYIPVFHIVRMDFPYILTSIGTRFDVLDRNIRH